MIIQSRSKFILQAKPFPIVFLLGVTCAQSFGVAADFAIIRKCESSLIVEEEVGIPRIFIAPQDLKNVSVVDTLRVKLAAAQFLCDEEKGRTSSLKVSPGDAHAGEVLTFFRSGYILHDKTYFSREEFCLESVSDDGGLSLKICEPRCNSMKDHACVQKCCEPGKVWDLQNYEGGTGKLSCVPSGPKLWRPYLFSNKYERVDAEKGKDITVRFKDSHPKNFCDGGFFLLTLKDYDDMEASVFRVLKNGNVIMKVGRSSWEVVPPTVYCVDGALNFKSEMAVEGVSQGGLVMGTEGSSFSGNESDTVMLVCTEFLEDPDTSFEGSTNFLYVYAMMVASVFLFMTVVVYALLWKRQNIHGWTFLGYVVSLLLNFVFLSSAHLMSNGVSGDVDCSLVGIACHFFFLSTFAWLTVLNFDIYWSFRSLNPNPGRRKELIRFLYYSGFAIGLPTVIVLVGVILDAIYGDDPESEVIVPRYGVTRCTLDRTAELPYLFGPVSALLCCNLVLFPTTLYYIYRSRKMTKLSGMKNSMLKHKIRFFGKLFMLAGVTWIFEVLSWACTEPGKPYHWIWKFLDLVNILQAVAIFVVFVCNRKTLDELSERFSCFKRLTSVIEKASGAAAHSVRRQSHTHMSSVFDAPGLDTIELSWAERKTVELMTQNDDS